VKIRILGESHAPEIGVEIEDVREGFPVDLEELQRFLDRRAPGNGQGGASTSRKEPDRPVFVQGLRDGVTTGEAIRAVIRNTNIRPQDYGNVITVPRPGHADYSSWLKTGRIATGGGKWSGRMTAPLCIAGGIALQMLARQGVRIAARVQCVGGGKIDPAEPSPDSVGAVVEVVATGVPKGLGDVGTEGMESKLSAAFFGIPAVKGVEFGDGFALAAMRGSEANDAFVIQNGEVTLASNHCGGILGGVTVGMPIVARLAFKPTPSIALEQDSVDLVTMRPVKLVVKGRHDRCVAFRAVPVVEAAMAIVLAKEMNL